MKKIILKTNVMTIILVVITIISTTTAILGLVNQNRLNNVITMQNAKIGELIKIKKDLLFSKEVSNDSSITSIAELKKMVEELRDNRYKTDASDVLGITTNGIGETKALVGMVTINKDLTSIDIYDNPSSSATILVNTMPSPPIMFYYQKQQGWYQVEYSTNQFGWVSDDVITEVSE